MLPVIETTLVMSFPCSQLTNTSGSSSALDPCESSTSPCFSLGHCSVFAMLMSVFSTEAALCSMNPESEMTPPKLHQSSDSTIRLTACSLTPEIELTQLVFFEHRRSSPLSPASQLYDWEDPNRNTNKSVTVTMPQHLLGLITKNPVL